jgi:hypothetical protein
MTASATQQVTHPATMLTQDNNGVILEIAQVSDGGSRTATGTSTTASVGFNVANGLTLSWSGKQRLQRHRRVLERNAGLRSAVLLRAACVLRLRG